MDENIPTTDNIKDGKKENNEPKNHIPSNISRVTLIEKVEENKSGTSQTQQHKENKEIQSTIKPKRKIFKKKRVQIIMMAVNIGMFGFFIIFSWIQSCQTTRSIDLATKAMMKTDSYTRSSLKLTQYADSLAKISLDRSILADSVNQIFTIKDTLARDRSIKRELRAYLSINKIQNISITETLFTLDFVFCNTGKTPAYGVYGMVVCKPGGTGVYEYEINNLSKTSSKTTVFMQANGVDFVITTNFLREENVTTFESIKKHDRSFFIFGIIYYSDIFKQIHRTRFCYEMKIINDSTYNYSRYKKYNDGD